LLLRARTRHCTYAPPQVKTLLGFAEKRAVFDFVLLETTGLADPSPIVR
jgi:G3E family GTPase